MKLKIMVITTTAAAISFAGSVSAHHGDCVYNDASGRYISIPEPAGAFDIVEGGGLGHAADNDGTPFNSGVDWTGPCDGEHPWPTTADIPGGEANPNAIGAPYGSGGNAP